MKQERKQGTMSNRSVLRALKASLDAREAVALISITGASGDYIGLTGRNCVVWPDPERKPIGQLDVGVLAERVYGDARRALDERKHRHLHYETEEGSLHAFVEVQVKAPHLIIVGAGHIAVPLAAIAKLNDFEVTVLDDRPQYAHPARFPEADRVIAGPFREEIDALRADAPNGGKQPFGGHTYMVLVTRGHQYDIDSLLEVINDPLAYIGMIGSRRRIRAVFELLETEKGIAPEKFDRVYAPIGIDIGARTPAEIAVCIMAEIINVLRDGPAVPLSRLIKEERQQRRERAANRAD